MRMFWMEWSFWAAEFLSSRVLNNFKLCFICFICWFVFRPSINLQTRSGWETCRLLPGENIWINLTLRLHYYSKSGSQWVSETADESAHCAGCWRAERPWVGWRRARRRKPSRTRRWSGPWNPFRGKTSRSSTTSRSDSLSVLYDPSSELITTTSPDSLNKCSDLRAV